MRPAKITFPGEHQEKLENIARVSLKIADKVIPSISSKKGRKSSKNDPSEDVCQKQCTSKYSPLKNNEDNEKIIAKSKRDVKFAFKTANQKKVLKRIGAVEHAIVNKKIRISQCKNKREKKTEETDALLEHNELDITEEKLNEFTETETISCTQLLTQDNLSSAEVIMQNAPSTSNESNSSKSRNYITNKILLRIETRMVRLMVNVFFNFRSQ